MTITDRRGGVTSAGQQVEIDAFDDGFDLFLNYERAAPAALKKVESDHPQLIMASILSGYMALMLESNAARPRVSVMATTKLAEASHANTRECYHLEAIDRWARGDVYAAAEMWDRALADDPLDLLALKMHHYTTFWTGRSNVLLATVDGVIDAWKTDTPGYGHVVGMRAFALGETGRYEEAEVVARDAVERNPEDLWSIHALAHALEMQGDHASGAAFFDVDPEIWSTKNPFVRHVWWHAALFEWNAGAYDRVLKLYDDRIRPADGDFFFDVQNLSSLLARLELAGVDVADRWDELGDHAAARVGDHVLALTDAHCALALARTGQVSELAAFTNSLEHHLSTQPSGRRGRAGIAVVVEMCRALMLDADGDLAGAADGLARIRGELAPIGGSHVQRDVFDLVLIDALEQSRQDGRALNLLRARTKRWPTSVPTWQRYANALAASGRYDEAEAAVQRTAEVSRA